MTILPQLQLVLTLLIVNGPGAPTVKIERDKKGQIVLLNALKNFDAAASALDELRSQDALKHIIIDSGSNDRVTLPPQCIEGKPKIAEHCS